MFATYPDVLEKGRVQGGPYATARGDRAGRVAATQRASADESPGFAHGEGHGHADTLSPIGRSGTSPANSWQGVPDSRSFMFRTKGQDPLSPTWFPASLTSYLPRLLA